MFFVALSHELTEVTKWGGGVLALGAALTSGIATFFNFGKLFEGHRAIANKYLALATKCETTMARFRDELIDAGGLDALLREHQERYAEINDEAKALPTNERDFRSALRIESKRASFRGKGFGIRAAM